MVWCLPRRHHLPSSNTDRRSDANIATAVENAVTVVKASLLKIVFEVKEFEVKESKTELY